jgi:hypothetical protein
MDLQNCTILNNRAACGGGHFTSGCSIHINNTIFWGDAPGELYNAYGTGFRVDYSCIQGGYAGASNLSTHPQMVANDYHLWAASPCRRHGSTVVALTNDIDREARVLTATVDIGCDEFMDTDADGLPDFWENKYGGSPPILLPTADPDQDGFSHLDEYQNGTDPFKPTGVDSDHDGLLDGFEISIGLDADRADTDGDSMPDGWEYRYGLNATNDDSAADADSDQLSNLQEWMWGATPTNTDSDADGLGDGEEVYGTRTGYPSDPASTDTDEDGIPDGQDWFTNSPTGDQDGDGTPDALDGDADNDGLTNGADAGSCLNWLKPDSDDDGVPDGVDSEPCNSRVWASPSDTVAPIPVIVEPTEEAQL